MLLCALLLLIEEEIISTHPPFLSVPSPPLSITQTCWCWQRPNGSKPCDEVQGLQGAFLRNCRNKNRCCPQNYWWKVRRVGALLCSWMPRPWHSRMVPRQQRMDSHCCIQCEACQWSVSLNIRRARMVWSWCWDGQSYFYYQCRMACNQGVNVKLTTSEVTWARHNTTKSQWITIIIM